MTGVLFFFFFFLEMVAQGPSVLAVGAVARGWGVGRGHNVSLDYHLAFVFPVSTDSNAISRGR